VPFANLTGCSLSLDLNGAAVGMYAVALQLEDFVDENSTYAMSSVIYYFIRSSIKTRIYLISISKVPLQFLLVIVPATSNCTSL